MYWRRGLFFAQLIQMCNANKTQCNALLSHLGANGKLLSWSTRGYTSSLKLGFIRWPRNSWWEGIACLAMFWNFDFQMQDVSNRISTLARGRTFIRPDNWPRSLRMGCKKMGEHGVGWGAWRFLENCHGQGIGLPSGPCNGVHHVDGSQFWRIRKHDHHGFP